MSNLKRRGKRNGRQRRSHLLRLRVHRLAPLLPVAAHPQAVLLQAAKSQAVKSNLECFMTTNMLIKQLWPKSQDLRCKVVVWAILCLNLKHRKMH